MAVDTTAAEAYEKFMVPGMFLHWTRLVMKVAAPQPGEHVLDVACGTGIGARLAADAVAPGGRLTGLDIDAGVIELARGLAGNSPAPIDWHRASALDMPFEDGAFDLCLCLQGLQFFPDRVAGLAEIRRVLRPAGRLVASIWGPLDCNKGHAAVVTALERQQVDASTAKRACSFADTGEIRAAARSAGFGNIALHTEDGVSHFASFDAFLDGMTIGSPSTRHAVAQLSDTGRAGFMTEVRETLEPYVTGGELAYPMRTHILVAKA